MTIEHNVNVKKTLINMQNIGPNCRLHIIIIFVNITTPVKTSK